ncbi:MAG: energy-coupling factor transporter transmembrane component T, partial [Peptococcaceae bacterium]|nr:energy-coupling factor transporter transmembrane component T [Peptococcaceae bacterium]
MEKYAPYQPPKKTGFYLDPRTKILFMAFITTLMFFVYENLAMDAAVAMIPLTLLLINRQLRTALIYGGLFALALVAKLTQGMVAMPDILNMIAVLLIAMVIRLFPIFMLGYYIVESTKTDEFVAAMEKWRVPQAFIIPISVVFRFIPTLGEESAAITDAMRLRGIQFGTKKFWQAPTAILEYRVVPLMLSVVKIGD